MRQFPRPAFDWRHLPIYRMNPFSELLTLENNFAVIRQELENILPNRETIPRYHEIDPLQVQISGSDDSKAACKVFLLYAMREKPEANRQKCPRTSELLDRIPNLFQASFSVLEGGKSVPAHRGPYRGYLRYHLALIVPQQNPPRMRVKDQWVSWREGEGFVFDDTWDHEVVNQSKDVRVVLMVDVLRPLGQIGDFVNRAIFHGLKYTYVKRLVARS